MKSLLLVLSLIFGTSSVASQSTSISSISSNPNLQFVLTELTSPIRTSEFLLSNQSVVENVKFYCANHQNPIPTLVRLDTPSAGKDFPFNFSIPTYFLVHGDADYFSRPGGFENLTLPQLLKYTDSNICAVDYRFWASLDYATIALIITARVSNFLASVLSNLRSQGLNFNNLHLVGFSVGAQIVGYTGRLLNGEILNITGLDPAGPIFCTIPGFPYLLDPSSGQFVQTMMSNPGVFGCIFELGDLNFYINLEFFAQSGCLFLNPFCAHDAARYVWGNSVNPANKFIGVECGDQVEALLDDFYRVCDYNQTNVAGIYATKENATYYVRTNANYLPAPLPANNTSLNLIGLITQILSGLLRVLTALLSVF